MLLNPAIFAQVEALGREHKLDISDALQLETIKRGYFAAFQSGSAPVLITGDERLASAARSGDIRVWDCRREPAPFWLDPEYRESR